MGVLSSLKLWVWTCPHFTLIIFVISHYFPAHAGCIPSIQIRSYLHCSHPKLPSSTTCSRVNVHLFHPWLWVLVSAVIFWHLCIQAPCKRYTSVRCSKKHCCITWSLPLTTLTYSTLKFIPKTTILRVPVMTEMHYVLFFIVVLLVSIYTVSKTHPSVCCECIHYSMKIIFNKHDLVIVFLF